MGSQTRLLVELESDTGSDEVELAEVTDALRRALLELDVEAVDAVQAAAVPQGAKAGDAVAAGTWAVTMTPVILTSVVALLKTWLSDRQLRSVTLTIDGDTIVLPKASREDQQRALDAFLRTHGAEHGTT